MRRPHLVPRRAAAALMSLLVAACGSDGSPVVAPDRSTTTSTPPASTTTTSTTTAPEAVTSTTVAAPVWVVGATPLPLRPDGYGEILPTPAVLVDRRLPTTDRLPPPASGGFESSVAPIDEAVRTRMGGTYQDGCPVAIEDLRYVTVSFLGFDDRLHTGELVVHAEVAADVVSVFERLFDARFPLEEMRLITDVDVAAAPTGDGNNTAAFICRAVRGGTRFSAHASGLAIDVNPFHNPYVRGEVVLPELASAYADRSVVRPGMIFDGDVVVDAFESIGWAWGGRWDSPVDTMHFSATGG